MKYRIFLLFILIQSFVFAQQSDSISVYSEIEIKSRLREIMQAQYADPIKAESGFRMLLDACLKTRQNALYAQVSKQLATFYFNQGKLNLAQEVAQKGISYSEDARLKSEFYLQSGNIALAQGRLADAANDYFKSLKIAENTHDPESLLNSYIALGNLFNRQNNFSRSIEYQSKALHILEHNKNVFKVLNTLENIGQLYLRMQRNDRAADYFARALRMYREMQNGAGEAAASQNLGNALANMHQYESAAKAFRQALSISEKLQIHPMTVAALNALAECEAQTGNLELAGKHYRQSVFIAKRFGLNIELNNAYEGLSNLYKIAHEQSKSLTYQMLSKNMKDSIFNDSALRQLTNMQLQYESGLKQKQIELLQKDTDLKALQLEQEKQLRYWLFAFISALSIGFLVVVYFIIRYRKTARELQQQNVAILKSKESLKQLHSVKDRFFSIISHDLRNSLSSMKLFFEMQQQKIQSEEDRKMHQEIASSVNNTIDLLENLLVWANEQIKGRPIRSEKLLIYPMVAENFRLIQATATSKSIELENLCDEESSVKGDPDMVQLILRNLISNAVKFTRPHGNVSVNQYSENGWVYITVIDNGIGISEKNQQQLFTRFENTSTKGTGNEKGTGLGLLLCKEYAEKNGGRIEVESEAGKGSCFTLILPEN